MAKALPSIIHLHTHYDQIVRMAHSILTTVVMGNIPFSVTHHGETTVMHRQSMPLDRTIKRN